MCQHVSVCVVFVVLLVASVLASMRGLLWCGDGSKKKNEICHSKKNPARKIFHYGLNLFEKKRIKLQSLQICVDSKTIKSAPRISVIILAQMVLGTSKQLM